MKRDQSSTEAPGGSRKPTWLHYFIAEQGPERCLLLFFIGSSLLVVIALYSVEVSLTAGWRVWQDFLVSMVLACIFGWAVAQAFAFFVVGAINRYSNVSNGPFEAGAPVLILSGWYTNERGTVEGPVEGRYQAPGFWQVRVREGSDKKTTALHGYEMLRTDRLPGPVPLSALLRPEKPKPADAPPTRSTPMTMGEAFIYSGMPAGAVVGGAALKSSGVVGMAVGAFGGALCGLKGGEPAD